MRYLLLIYGSEDVPDPTPDEQGAVMAAYNAFTEHIRSKNAYLGGEALEPTATASSADRHRRFRFDHAGPVRCNETQQQGYRPRRRPASRSLALSPCYPDFHRPSDLEDAVMWQ